MRSRLRGALRWLWWEFVQGLILLGLSAVPGGAVLMPQSRPWVRRPGSPPACAHPERVVPYEELSDNERRFWERLADRATSGDIQ